jgi:hypothetical protein
VAETFEELADLLIEGGVRDATVRRVLAAWMDSEGTPSRSAALYADQPVIVALFAERGVLLSPPETPSTEAEFGAAVRAERQRRQWTQERLRRELVGHGYIFSKTMMHRLEWGQRPTTLGEALALSQILDIDLPKRGDAR